ncbi:MAG TPA: NAD-dependent dehydratase [Spirochaetaceae bacterium]|nr:NAD-dependent dehydratase [Spirochaetaceae bacterium]
MHKGRALFIGGTGNLSYDCSLRALDEGWELWHLNRGSSLRTVHGVHTLRADARDETLMPAVLGSGAWDVVVDFISFDPEQLSRARKVFEGRCAQFIFISSASCYHKPPLGGPIREDTPLVNPYWDYARRKIACEEYLAEAIAKGFPATIVRPSHTYGATWIPSLFGSADYTTAARMQEGKEILVFGDGNARWTLTHARDFALGLVGLMGNAHALGQTVQIMGDAAPSWNEIYGTLARLLGVKPRFLYAPRDFIASHDPGFAERLLGDKGYDTTFDCSKLKSLVPGFLPCVSLEQGLQESLMWFGGHPERMRVDAGLSARMDAVISAWKDSGGGSAP